MLDVQVYLVRHGETEWNREGRMQGHLDSPLSPAGEDQARRLARVLAPIPLDRIYSSSSGRAVRTAEILMAARHPAPPLVLSDALREIRHGAWEGRQHEDIRSAWPLLHQQYHERPETFPGAPGGETFQEVQARAVAFLQKQAASAAPGEHLLVVSHGVTIKLLLGWVLHRPLSALWTPPRVEPTALSLLSWSHGTFHVVRYADHSHLAPPEPV